ncbi:MAG: alpha/beta fold hydrolase [Pseudomonadota bacterium]
MTRHAVLIGALALVILSLWQIEAKRPRGVEVASVSIGTTPATEWRQPGAHATVVVAHGFAGSRPLMKAYIWTLVASGYDVVAFDFEGHGLNPVPMSGDTDSIEGTTRRLVDETVRVMDYAGDAPALLGHSMATDVLIRAALERPAGPIVAISAFSQAVTPQHPENLLLIAGEWEGRLIAFGQDAIRQVDPNAVEGQLLTGDVTRMALVSPNVEHVGILYAPYALRESIRWLDAAYGVPEREPQLATIGYWVLALLAGLMALWRPISGYLPDAPKAEPVPRKAILWCAGVALVTPLGAIGTPTGILPVLVADYLVVHLGFTGLMQLALLRANAVAFGKFQPVVALALVAWGLAVFGLAINSYLANFMPHAGRALILAVLILGAVPFMVADAIATQGGRGPLWHRLLLRGAFFASLIFAVALDFDRLFFLVLIAPVILLFFLIFGYMGRWTADRAGPLAAGVALGVILAWSLGVTFPMFAA